MSDVTIMGMVAAVCVLGWQLAEARRAVKNLHAVLTSYQDTQARLLAEVTRLRGQLEAEREAVAATRRVVLK